MDKILAALGIIGIALGGLFFSRSAKGETVNQSATAGVDNPAGSSTVGTRNNNPFNIEFRPSIDWRGQLGTDGRFAVFDTSLNGLRAGMINIHTKFVRDGANSVRRLIPILSPSFENPTEAFIQFVSRTIAVAPDAPLVFQRDIIKLSKAIVTFENGFQPYPDALYIEALRESGR